MLINRFENTTVIAGAHTIEEGIHHLGRAGVLKLSAANAASRSCFLDPSADGFPIAYNVYNIRPLQSSNKRKRVPESI